MLSLAGCCEQLTRPMDVRRPILRGEEPRELRAAVELTLVADRLKRRHPGGFVLHHTRSVSLPDRERDAGKLLPRLARLPVQFRFGQRAPFSPNIR